MTDKPQERNWFLPSLRDNFMLGGMFLGILVFEFGQRHLHPVPDFFWLIGPAFMLMGAAIGELVKRRQARRS